MISYDSPTWFLPKRIDLVLWQSPDKPVWKLKTGTPATYAETTASGRIAFSRNSYDIHGRAWKTETRNNVSGNFEATTRKYDLAGKQISTSTDNQTQETLYDALGRTKKTVFLSDTVVTAIQATEYDTAGHQIAEEIFILNPGETASVNPNGNNFVRQTTYHWHDLAGRTTTTANYGSGGPFWSNYAKPQHPATPPVVSSTDCLVTQYTYSASTGQREIVTTPEDTQTKAAFDALARTVKTYQNYKTGTSTAADEDVTIQYEYDGADNITTLTAVNPTTGDQITRYLYEDPYNASLQTSAIYPDSSDTTSGGTDQVKTQYYLDGNVKQITDQNGTTRTFTYDSHRRLISDHATTLGSGVDGAVRKITRSYNNFGAMETFSSQDAQNTVLDEIKYEYDANHRLKRLYQSHSGAASPTTPHLEYAYDETNQGRLNGITYPSGKALTYNYNDFDQIASISESQTPIVSYVYDGTGSPTQTAYPEPGLSLTYTSSALDRFGRITNYGWLKNNEPLVHILHGHDFAGNRTFRYDSVHAANSELYEYDAVNQIKSLNRGILDQNQSAVTNSSFTESWSFDKTGNWSQYEKNGTTEQRTHNKANELQGIATHDANGNMTLMPGLKGKYDAWNRLVEVRSTTDDLIARYEYNALNQRIKKTVDTTTTHHFYNENWQELESKEAGVSTPATVFVWGLRYIDDLIYREKGPERLYALQDPNWNVTAITDATGEVKERYRYNAFGKTTVLDVDFTEKPVSTFLWNRTFTGQVYDLETGLMLYRNRFYHADLGRFVNRDPILYESDFNVYRYVFNSSVSYPDSHGLQPVVMRPPPMPPRPMPIRQAPLPPLPRPPAPRPRAATPAFPTPAYYSGGSGRYPQAVPLPQRGPSTPPPFLRPPEPYSSIGPLNSPAPPQTAHMPPWLDTPLTPSRKECVRSTGIPRSQLSHDLSTELLPLLSPSDAIELAARLRADGFSYGQPPRQGPPMVGQTCSTDHLAFLMAIQHALCDARPMACSGNYSYEKNLEYRQRFIQCIAIRQIVMDDCFGGGDQRHKKQIQQRQDGLASCNRILNIQ